MAPGEGAGKLFFWGDDGVHGHELWMSDGTEEGTVPLKDFVQAKSSVPFGLTASGDHLFFTATDGSHGYELWKTDGTAEGTVLTHRSLEEMMKGYEYQSDFAKKYVAQGRAEEAARALLTVLRARGMAVPDAVCERVLAQKDLERLERWLEKAAVATSVDAVFDEPN